MSTASQKNQSPQNSITSDPKIYLISPPQIDLNYFFDRLKRALQTSLVPVFQLRLKDYDVAQIKEIALEVKKICDDNNCLFLLNDYYEIAAEIGAGGVHVGADDLSISSIRKKSPENFVIGASCYDSKHLAMEAAEQGADYLSFGAFFESKTKKSRGAPTTEILTWCREMMNLPIVAIGGINNTNCQSLVKSGADFVAVISYIWDHPKGESEAINLLNDSLKSVG